MTGTHDTEPVATWWDELPAPERRLFSRLSVIAHSGAASADAPWSDRLRDAILELAYHSGTDRLFFPVQDVFGWRDRINTPGTVTPDNWTWSLPWPVDRLEGLPVAQERAADLRRLALAAGRLRATEYTSSRPEAGAAGPGTSP
jgi:4-alpha-glucanotransferase